MWVSTRQALSLTLLVLIGSVGANAYLLVRSRASLSTKRASPTREGESSDPGCAAELETCRLTSSRLALGLWESAWRKSPSAGTGALVPPPSVEAGAPPAASTKISDPEITLCRLARDTLRDKWLATKDEITETVVHGFSDAAYREDAEHDAAHAADMLGLEGRGRRTFEDDFAAVREKRMADLASAIQTTPVDWGQILVIAKSQFDAEDALVEREVGSAASQRYRDSQSGLRMTILTAVATYADVDWDDAVAQP